MGGRRDRPIGRCGRRQFLAALGAVGLHLGYRPRPAHGQPRTHLIGVLASEPWRPIEGLREGLERLGYSSRQVSLEYRWFQGQSSRLPEMAADLVRVGCDAIVTVGTPAALAAKRATASTRTPVIMGLIGDPVGAGLVSNIARPDGNLTGVSVLAAELEPKRLELLKQFVPALSRVRVLGNADNPYSTIALGHAKRGADALGLRLEPVLIKATTDIEKAFLDAADQPTALLVVADQALLARRAQLAELTRRARFASAFTYREHVEAGGLLSYSTDYRGAFRLASTYVDRILKGSAPGDLPIQQVTKFELIINQRTAAAIGVLIPPILLSLADELIE